MDAWLRVPGAWVVDHGARVHGTRDGCYVVCTCGFQSQVTGSVDNSCLALVDHLQRCVRAGAQVRYGEGGGESGVREPRRPLHPLGSASADADVTRSA